MLIKINKLMKKKAMSTAELVLTVSFLTAGIMVLATFFKRQLGKVTQDAAMFSSANNGLGMAYAEHGYAPDDTESNLNKTTDGQKTLILDPGLMTSADDTTDNSTGTETTTPSQ